MKKKLCSLLLALCMVFSLLPTVALAANITATPMASTVQVNRKDVQFEAYTINGNNYFKLRDLAMALNSTKTTIAVGYNNAKGMVTVNTKAPYVPVGGELKKGDGKAKVATPSNAVFAINGVVFPMEAYNIGGNNFVKLRDLMEKIQVYVGWNDKKKLITIVTTRPYEHIAAHTLEPAPKPNNHYFISRDPKGGSGITPGSGQFIDGTIAVFGTPSQYALRATAEPGYYTLSFSTKDFIAYLTAATYAGGGLTYEHKSSDNEESQMFALVRANDAGGYYLQTKNDLYVQDQHDMECYLTLEKIDATVLYFRTPEFYVPPQVEAPQLKAGAHYHLAGDTRDGTWTLMPLGDAPGGVVGIMPFRDISMTLVPDEAAPGWFNIVYDIAGGSTYLTVKNGVQKALTVMCSNHKKGDDSQRFQFVKMSSNGGYYIKTTEGFYVREYKERSCLTGEMLYAHPFYFLEKAD
ncbi:MAG: hypothetical protein RRY64_02035 [Oscillospiraceae bacterium]